MANLTKVKTIRTYTGLARFLAECSEEPIGTIPRQILSPYAYAPNHMVFWHEEEQYRLIFVETAHREYEVLEVHPNAKLGEVRE